MSNSAKNQGEGNRTAARNYNKDAREFVESTDQEEITRRARNASPEDERRIRNAEEKGKSRAKETQTKPTR